MIWGLVISVFMTAVVLLLAFNVKKKEKAGVLSWVVVIVGFAALWIFGARLSENIEGRTSAVQLRDSVSLGLNDLASNNLSSEMASFVAEFGLVNMASEYVAGEAVHYYTVRLWIDVAILLVIFVAMLVFFMAFMEGRGGRSRSRATERHGGSGRNPKYHSRRR